MNIRPYKDHFPLFGTGCYIDPSSVVIGDVVCGEQVSIWPLVAIRGDVNQIRIGDRTNVQDGSILHVTRTSPIHPQGFPLLIGNNVTIGHQCVLHGCKLGDKVLVGMGSLILDGAEIENEVLIGAGTLVPQNKILESGYLYMGQPCQKKRPITNDERQFLKQSALNYVTLKQDYCVGTK